MDEEHQYQTSYQNEWSEKEQQLINGLKEIYQQAINQFPTNENLLKRYNDFLEGINDQQNQRSLLNFALELYPDNHQFVWNLFEQFEKKCGTFDSLMDFEEKQMKDFEEKPNQLSADAKFSFIWIKDLFSYRDKQPFNESDDMEYKTMKQFYNSNNQYDMEIENINVGEEYDMLTQFRNILPLNYVGKTKVDVDYLIELLVRDDDPLLF